VRNAKVVVTIPDLSFLRFPQFAEPKNLKFLKRQVPRSIERADRIIAISEFTAREICEFFPSAKDKVAVTQLGVTEAVRRIEDKEVLAAVKARYNLPDDYILFVGTLEPRKNLMTLLEAYRTFAGKSKEHAHTALVVAGMKGWLTEETMRRIGDMPRDMSPRLIGYIEETDLPALYSGARMAVVPSLYEGFGLPCLEAMACGTPLVCSNTASLPEVVGDAAILVSPHEPEEIAQAMVKVVESPEVAEDLADRGRRRAAQFTWERCAEETYRVYEAAMAG
jgi:glycosyltransferase involved in cell wall biosynthesis